MKTRTLIFLGCVFVSCLATKAFGEFGQTVRASEIIGSVINVPQDTHRYTVKDLAIDLENGRIVEVIVAQGSRRAGFLGLESKIFAVSPENFALGNEGKSLSLNLTAEKLGGAPPVDLSKWKECMTQSRVEEVYQYYGATPYFLVEEHPAHQPNNPVMLHFGEAERASRLIGTETLNPVGAKVGKMENLIVNFPDGRIVEATIASGSFLGMRGELSALPPQVLHFDASRDALTLNTTKEELSTMPHFPSGSWPQIDRDQATAVYQAYHILPYFLPIGIAGPAENAPPVNSRIQTLPEQGTSPADLEITAKIQKELLDTDGLSVDARAVKIVTSNGHVTLSGMVASMEEKRRVGDIAARIVPPENVDNRLQVKETASTAG